MTPIRHTLPAPDFDEAADEAAGRAMEPARKLEAEITVFHVSAPPHSEDAIVSPVPAPRTPRPTT